MNEENEIFKEIERDAFHNWDSLTNEQKQTKRYVLAALKSSELPRLDYNFIPDSLKGDRDVTLEAFKRKRECAYSYDTHFQKLLTELTYNWRNDRELILALCENRLAPQALSNASDSLKEDEQVVRAVCMHDPNNLEHCGPNIRQKLIADRDFMLSIISEETNGKMLAYASKALRSDRDLVAEALRHGFPYDDIALELKEDRALLREAITKDCTVYMKLPDALKSDSVLAAAAVMCGSSTRTEYEDDELAFDNEYKVVVEDAFKHAPGIFSNRKIMWEAAPSSPFDRRDCWNTTFQHCHESLRNDRELVLRFLKTTRAVYENLNVSLRRDPEVIACAIDGCCSCCSSFITELISFVPRDCLIEHPELAIRAFDRGRGAFFQEFNVRYIPRRLFRRLDVAQAYADNGGKMCTQGFPKDHCDNHDLCLRFLKNDLYPIFLDIRKCYSHVLNWVSENLLRDKSFMVEALNAFSGRMHIHLLLGKFQRAKSLTMMSASPCLVLPLKCMEILVS